MTIREEYEDLKLELTVKLADTTEVCKLDFPFDFKISKEDEDRYFLKGLRTRVTTKKMGIMLDNAYKKVRLFPSKDIAKIYIETRDGILNDYRKNVLAAYNVEPYRFDDSEEVFMEYIETLIQGITEATKPYIEKLKTLTQEDIDREIEAKDKLKKAGESPLSLDNK